jgi:hypothetical protein
MGLCDVDFPAAPFGQNLLGEFLKHRGLVLVTKLRNFSQTSEVKFYLKLKNTKNVFTFSKIRLPPSLLHAVRSPLPPSSHALESTGSNTSFTCRKNTPHLSGIYRACIGYLSDIYRASIGKSRPMTDLCVVSAWPQNGL